ncbi:unnamed protein product [Durusdinium trenchii]|uniref:tRNA (guanine(26)-N(2))-dimethyltransferase n=1 Tax=Durusdinium trenchii TaxID=1381693 RepID=A0ABP0Q5H4_9DINO
MSDASIVPGGVDSSLPEASEGPAPASITEGLAEVLPVNAKRKDGKNDVFYNPAQVFNRDLSVLVLSVFAKVREEEFAEKDRLRLERFRAKVKVPEVVQGEQADERENEACKELPKEGDQPPSSLLGQEEVPNEGDQPGLRSKEEVPNEGDQPGPSSKEMRQLQLPTPSGLKVLEALAATGIRTVRYAKELPFGPGGIASIVANDLDPNAVEHMKRNFAHNELPSHVQAVNSDANAHMYSKRAKGTGGLGLSAYDVIDLDPYGTVAPFIDSAVQAVADGGLLCITSTDMPVLGGNHPETCFARYGGSALKCGYVHEMALRLVLHAFATAAARCGREVRPLLSVSIDFYVRLFVRVFDSPARVKRHASKTGLVHQCVQCESFFVQKFGEIEGSKEAKFKVARVTVPGSECPECKGRMKVGGPFHCGPLYDRDFLQRCLQVCSAENMSSLPGIVSWKKITGLLTAMSEENDEALYYKLPNLCKSLKVNQMPLRQFRGTLISLGYRVSHFHREPQAIKTDAPNHVVFDLLRLWAEEHPPTNCPLPELLKKEFSLSRPLEWKTESHEGDKVAKFLPNPEPNWGPKPRARSGVEKPEDPTEPDSKKPRREEEKLKEPRPA